MKTKIEIQPFTYREIPIATFDWLLETNQIIPISHYTNNELQETIWRTIKCHKTYT